MSPGTIIILCVLALIIGLVIFSMFKQKKSGKSGCGCGCEGCPSKNQCHK